jgi:uncharacterized protein (TIGR02453 family)
MLLRTTLDFLAALRENNHTDWFHAHRKEYDQARQAFESFIAQVIAQFQRVDDVGDLAPKDAIHRINRDIRFAQDKSPYNTFMSAVIGPEGRKSLGRAYYIRVAPGDQSLLSSGATALSDSELYALRQHIAKDAQPLRAIMQAPAFQQYFGTLAGEQVKTAPKGFDKNHPDIDLLRYKEFLAQHSIPDEAVTRDEVVAHIITVCQAAKPLTDYFDQLLGPRSKPERAKH